MLPAVVSFASLRLFPPCALRRLPFFLIACVLACLPIKASTAVRSAGRSPATLVNRSQVLPSAVYVKKNISPSPDPSISSTFCNPSRVIVGYLVLKRICRNGAGSPAGCAVSFIVLLSSVYRGFARLLVGWIGAGRSSADIACPVRFLRCSRWSSLSGKLACKYSSTVWLCW